MKTTQHFLISGMVQGVGFRRFVERSARELELTGWVRNLDDGRVEAIATGDTVTLAKFGILLKEGPRLSKVTDVACKDLNALQSFSDFTVTKDGEKPWL
jgi:acylphosphatase